MLDELEDNVKSQLLIDFRGLLRTKKNAPVLSDVREIAETAGIKTRLSTSRNQAVDELIRFLINKEAADIKCIIEVAAKRKTDLNSEYSKWVDHILGRRD